MTKNAAENYGRKYTGVILVITHSAHSYMPARKFYASGSPDGFHPGYDDTMKGSLLHDLRRIDTGEPLGMSLYDYELDDVA